MNCHGWVSGAGIQVRLRIRRNDQTKLVGSVACQMVVPAQCWSEEILSSWLSAEKTSASYSRCMPEAGIIYSPGPSRQVKQGRI